MQVDKIRTILLVAILVLFLGDKAVDVSQAQARAAGAVASETSLASRALVPANGGSSGYISVPAAAFQPLMSSYVYINSGVEVRPEDMNSTLFYAPLQLPHGATITKVTFFWRDTSTYNGYVTLERSILSNGTGEIMATVYTVDNNPGVYSTSETNIANPVVDNAHHSYYLNLGLFWDSYTEYVSALTVIIEYSYLAYLPLSLR
jgi:hypothetical protein